MCVGLIRKWIRNDWHRLLLTAYVCSVPASKECVVGTPQILGAKDERRAAPDALPSNHPICATQKTRPGPLPRGLYKHASRALKKCPAYRIPPRMALLCGSWARVPGCGLFRHIRLQRAPNLGSKFRRLRGGWRLRFCTTTHEAWVRIEWHSESWCPWCRRSWCK